MKQEELILGLKKVAGDDRVITDDASIEVASRDYIGFRRYHRSDGKIWVPKAACVVKPADTQQASEVLKFLNANRPMWCPEPAAPVLPWVWSQWKAA